MTPLCASTRVLLMARPRPSPPSWVRVACSKASKIFGNDSGSIPRPVSAISTRSWSVASLLVEIEICPPAGVNVTAVSIRFLEIDSGGDNRRKRCAQFVTEHGEELVLREVGARFFLKFLVGILKFGCERLGLSEQVFRLGVRFDRVQNNSDAFGQLIKESLMR